MKRYVAVLVLAVLAQWCAWPAGSKEGGGQNFTAYTATRAGIVAPGDVDIESYLSEVNYTYPMPEAGFGVTMYCGHRQLSSLGQEEILQIGIQAARTDFADLPPMNLAFVIDRSGSMSDAEKIDWVKDAFDVFIDKVRDIDYVSLVIFNEKAEVVFPSTRMSSARTRDELKRAVHAIAATGSTNIKSAVELGSLEVVKNLSREYVNRVIFVSDGCDTCGNTGGSILNVAQGFCDEGVTISTIGVGRDFDVQLMNDLARMGGGSSRFISDREQLQKIFGSELDRMVVPVARNLEMTLEFLVDVDILDTWGYSHQTSGNTIRYFLPSLHNGDYETILVHVRTRPRQLPGPTDFARFSVTYQSTSGESARSGPFIASVDFVRTPDPIVGYSDAMVLRSGTRLQFAQNLKRIGELCGPSAGPVELQKALDLTLETKTELLDAGRRLESSEFDKEVDVVNRYLVTLGKELQVAEETSRTWADSLYLPPPPSKPSASDCLRNLCAEIVLDLRARGKAVVALCRFSPQGTVDDALLSDLSAQLAAQVSGIVAVRTVEQQKLATAIAQLESTRATLTDKANALSVGRSVGADYILTGTAIRGSASLIVFSRLLNVHTGEVEATAQVIVQE